MKHTYTVLVGNIGTVHQGSRKRVALDIFRSYKKDSETACGAAANEEVTLLVGGEPSLSHVPETTVTAFVGSAWYEYCDPFLSVAFNPGRKPFATELKAAYKLERLSVQYAIDDWNGCDSGQTKTDFIGSVRDSGVSLETGVELTDEQRSDFYGKQGYCYFDGL
jgi:hypothetical protein